MRIADALAELDGRQPERMVPDLSRITALVELLGHPERTYPSIHVTGTNGKTTTARMITNLACAHGLTTGTYTSPHLERVAERISLCGDPLDDGEFAEEYQRLLPYLQEVDRRGERVTYFETLTALAYLWFADKPVALAVFEVGMGGVWDATNLVTGDVAVICPIALDHPELGSTVAEVAREKAGIIKDGKVAVVRAQPPDALEVIEERCRETSADLMLEEREFSLTRREQAVGGQVVTIRGPHGSYEELVLPLFGEHAARNAAAAVAAVEALMGRALSGDVVREALAGATSPGRMEVVGRHPLVVLDGAHNPAAAAALAAALPDAFSWDRLLLVLGVSANKDIPGIVRALAPLASRAFVTPHSSPRTAAVEVLHRACREAEIDADAFPSVADALEAARGDATETDLILVTGSLYTVADARAILVPDA